MIIIIIPIDFFHTSFSVSLSNKFPLVTRTLLSILAYLNNAVVCMVSNLPQYYY